MGNNGFFGEEDKPLVPKKEIEEMKGKEGDTSKNDEPESIIEKVKKAKKKIEEKAKSEDVRDGVTFFKEKISGRKIDEEKDFPETTKDREARSKRKIGIVAGIIVISLFGIKTVLDSNKNTGNANVTSGIPAPDSGSTSIFGAYNPEIGAIRGQVVTSEDVKRQIEKAAEERTKELQKEIERLRRETSEEKRKNFIVAQNESGNGSSSTPQIISAPAAPKPPSAPTNAPAANGEGKQNNEMNIPELPQVNRTGNTLISPPGKLTPLNGGPSMSSNYPMVGQGATVPTGGADFAVGGDKVYSYSPVTDAIKGAANAAGNMVNNGKNDPLNKNGTQGSPGAVRGKDPVAIIPASTIVDGVMLSGLDAGTGENASNDPMPVVMQLMDDGTTASFFNVPIKGCRIILAGFGDLPSERVYMRLERLVCIARTGEVYSAAASGVVLGEDGKNGMRGRVVDKRGAILFRTLVAGTLQGIGEVLTNNTMTTTVSPITGTITSPSLSGKDLQKAVVGGGLSKTAEKLADYYMKQADKMFPVIEIDAGRDVEVMFTRDLEFFPVSRIMQTTHSIEGQESNGFWSIPVSNK